MIFSPNAVPSVRLKREGGRLYSAKHFRCRPMQVRQIVHVSDCSDRQSRFEALPVSVRSEPEAKRRYLPLCSRCCRRPPTTNSCSPAGRPTGTRAARSQTCENRSNHGCCDCGCCDSLSASTRTNRHETTFGTRNRRLNHHCYNRHSLVTNEKCATNSR